MAHLVAVGDDRKKTVWVNPSWVKSVTAQADGGTIIHFMDGDQLNVPARAPRVVQRLNRGLASPTRTEPKVEPQAEPQPEPAQAVEVVSSLRKWSG